MIKVSIVYIFFRLFSDVAVRRPGGQIKQRTVMQIEGFVFREIDGFVRADKIDQIGKRLLRDGAVFRLSAVAHPDVLDPVRNVGVVEEHIPFPPALSLFTVFLPI